MINVTGKEFMACLEAYNDKIEVFVVVLLQVPLNNFHIVTTRSAQHAPP